MKILYISLSFLILIGTNLEAIDFPEFYSDQHKLTLEQYIGNIEQECKLLNAKDIDSHKIQDLRNKVDYLYSSLGVRLSLPRERDMLAVFHKVLGNAKEPYVRMEAAITLGIIKSTSSLPFLQDALSDGWSLN